MIHNDIKGDNFVFCVSLASNIEPILIDLDKHALKTKEKATICRKKRKKIMRRSIHILPQICVMVLQSKVKCLTFMHLDICCNTYPRK